MATDNKFSGFLYIPNNPNGFIDSSIAVGSDDISNNPGTSKKVTFYDILSKFKDPVQLTFKSELVASGNSMIYIVENTDNSRDEINMNDSSSKWPSVSEIVRYIYDYFYANISDKTLTQLTSDIESRLVGDVNSEIGTISRTVYVAESLSITTLNGQPTKLAKINFSAVYDAVQNRTFEFYVNPENFIQEYTPDDPYIYVWYTPDKNADMSKVSAAITEVQNVIAEKILTQHLVYNARTVIDGNVSTTPIHIWSNRVIPSSGLKNPFLKVVQEQIRVTEPLLTEEQLIDKYPEIFTNVIRVIYCVSDNKTIGDTQMNGSSLYSSPIDYFKIKSLIQGLKIFGGESTSEHFEVFNAEANQIWVNMIAAEGITDKIPFYRPTIAGINALEEHGADPESTGPARRFLRTLVRIINNAFDGIDYNSSTDYQIDSSDPIISAPDKSIDKEYYSFTFKAVEWHVYTS